MMMMELLMLMVGGYSTSSSQCYNSNKIVSEKKKSLNLIIIILADRRKWQLELTSAFDVNRMLFALVEGKRAVETGVSSYLHPSSIQTMTSRIL